MDFCALRKTTMVRKKHKPKEIFAKQSQVELMSGRAT